MLINWARAACHRQHLCFNFGPFFFCFVRRKFNYYCNIINSFLFGAFAPWVAFCGVCGGLSCSLHSDPLYLFQLSVSFFLLFCHLPLSLPLVYFSRALSLLKTLIPPFPSILQLTCTIKFILSSLFLLSFPSVKITS